MTVRLLESAPTLPPDLEATLDRATPLPEALAADPPRQDVWGEKGYLAQRAYRERFRPLLLTGRAARAVVYALQEDWDQEGPDVVARYAWRDEEGRLRAAELRESYDARHAALASGQGEMVVTVDGGLKLGKMLTVLYEPESGEHVIYEALFPLP